MKLTCDLIPSSSFYNNVRAILTAKQWDIVRKQVYKNANYLCQICGDVGPKHPIEAHEIWSYKNHIQKLEGMIGLCPNCHQCKHIGLAQLNGKFEQAVSHMMKINEMSKKKILLYIENEFKIWEQRSQIKWELDISHLSNYIELKI